MTTVDRRQPLPLYAQLEQALLSHIAEHGLQPGDRLPTEAEIADTYAVSRATIRVALNRLVADGWVERVQGLGSFVARPRPTHRPMLTSFTDNMRAQGYRPQRRVLTSAVVRAGEEQRALFGPRTTNCQYLRRLLLADGRPVGIAETWLPHEVLAGRADLFAPERLATGSLYDLLQGPEIGLRLHRGVETIRAARAGEAESELLECPPNSPTLVVRRVTYTPSDRAVESTVMTFASDRYEYRVELIRENREP